MKAASSKVLEQATAAVVMLFGLAVLLGARAITVRNETGGIDPRWWPMVLGAAILIVGAWMLVEALRRPIEREVAPAQKAGWVQLAATVAGLGLITALWELGVSFAVLGPLFLAAMNWTYGLRSWGSLLLFPVGVAAVMYLLFQLLLKVPL